MAETNIPKSDNMETISMNKTKKNFLQLNKLHLQKLSQENAIRKRDLSPTNSIPKASKSLRSSRRESFGNESSIRKTAASSPNRFLAGENKATRYVAGVNKTIRNVAKENKKHSLLPRSQITRSAKGILRKNQNQNQPIVEKKNQSVQSYNTANESFMKNAKVLEPSPHILAEIMENKKMESSKSKFVPTKRVFARHEEKEEMHLDNLKEYLETGSISRRRKDFEQRREELERKLGRYGKMSGSYSDPSNLFKPRPLTKHDIKTSLSTKMSTTAKYQTKTDLIGDSYKQNEDPKKLVLMYQRKLFPQI